MGESREDKRLRAETIIRRLIDAYPEKGSALDYGNPFQCLIATILSAQCTDAQVNKVTPGLFLKYTEPEAFADAELEDLETEIRSTGFYKNKAKAIQSCCRVLVTEHNGEVPDRLDALVRLPGVGRKTANCVIGNGYGQPAITVDTHVKRLAGRMDFTRETNPDKIESALRELWPELLWLPASNSLIRHGRAICKARKPVCSRCQVAERCPRRGVEASQ